MLCNLVIFPGVGAFEQLLGSGRGNLNKNFSKMQMPGGLPGGLPGGNVEVSISPVH